MAAKRKSMSTIKQILRFHSQGKKIKFIARSCGVSKNTVKRYLSLVSGLGHDLETILAMEEPIVDALLTAQRGAL